MTDPKVVAQMQARLDANVRGLWLLAKMQGGRVVIPPALVKQCPTQPAVLVQTDPATGGLIVQAL